MLLGVMWAVAAAAVGFAVGRASMYEKAENAGEAVDWTEVSGEAADWTETSREAAEEKKAEQKKKEKRGESAERRRSAGHGENEAQRKRTEGRTVLRRAEKRKTGKRTSEKKGSGAGMKFWSVGSPVSGEVSAYREGDRPVVVIRPDSDRLYAPVSGKVTRLFPMGNSFLFATEFGAELYIQAGEVDDELLGRYYRPKVVQNEIVGKGKLLLEFDRHGLETEGASAEVCVSVENYFYGGNVRIAAEGERVKAGEEILWGAE